MVSANFIIQSKYVLFGSDAADFKRSIGVSFTWITIVFVMTITLHIRRNIWNYIFNKTLNEKDENDVQKIEDSKHIVEMKEATL